ncbi:arsenate-mycothiol transferase ArsC [Oceanicella actignis]|uniref:Protein-tyrosine-phosphatase n=1 Tax=Oceanicella actignis TaxID=1189325 RepID=A0A1M7RY02_9RHOB|nr:low molecular weight phosphatase family protein [Oceanicella actignis]SES97375.1 Protein-tyrosine-phosphatase [Oceanicella actignis]SHN51187.1 Protein-tyrosine-phosphatase [Oceanicella actignis]
MAQLPSSVLFCCDHNAVRSPMAEGIMKKLHGDKVFVQSAGVRADMEVDGFAIAVCAEIGVELSRHQARSLDDLEALGEAEGYDLIVALSPAAKRAALERARWSAVEVEFWPVLDPTGIGRTRDERLAAYRMTRDQIIARIRARFPPF